jgi:hypothetical protein
MDEQELAMQISYLFKGVDEDIIIPALIGVSAAYMVTSYGDEGKSNIMGAVDLFIHHLEEMTQALIDDPDADTVTSDDYASQQMNDRSAQE